MFHISFSFVYDFFHTITTIHPYDMENICSLPVKIFSGYGVCDHVSHVLGYYFICYINLGTPPLMVCDTFLGLILPLVICIIFVIINLCNTYYYIQLYFSTVDTVKKK